MTKEQANKIIHTKLFGECWHVITRQSDVYFHCSCGVIDGCSQFLIDKHMKLNPDYFTLEALGPMWVKAIEQEWWQEFENIYVLRVGLKGLLDLERGPMVLAEYLAVKYK